MDELELPVFFPLYHGTNTKSQTMSKEEREELCSICFEIADISYKFLEKKYILDKNININDIDTCFKGMIIKMDKGDFSEYNSINEKLMEIFKDANDCSNVVAAFRMHRQNILGEGYFQYGNFYLTPSKEIASQYAYRGRYFGEIMAIAFELYKEASRFMKFDKSIIDNNKLEKFLFHAANPGEPMIITYEYVLEKCLLKENGKEITDEEWDIFSLSSPAGYRVKDGVDLSEYEVDREIIK